ncbi:hypothetical protein FNV43_RR02444 [Rhamnella rubrinervis]|uniref:DRBM domain-containing protein n=1 Tax=Rhamnella rubrinervis TaxID=2594499 RepID=A0A8K0HTJ5_9ROSA|nr:hypothetical protein FNV43_RR02444 [Rhamnella rubrinervis]
MHTSAINIIIIIKLEVGKYDQLSVHSKVTGNPKSHKRPSLSWFAALIKKRLLPASPQPAPPLPASNRRNRQPLWPKSVILLELFREENKEESSSSDVWYPLFTQSMAQPHQLIMASRSSNFSQFQQTSQTLPPPPPSFPDPAWATALALALAPAQAPTDHTPVPSGSHGLPEHVMFKNRLQEYTHKSGILLPVYHTVNEGLQHLPKFRSTVVVDGESYTSPNSFLHRKMAEQDAARIALESVSKKIKDERCPLTLIKEDTLFCKSILIEFAVKINMEKPTYNTIQHEGLLPVFTSSLAFNGVSYTGGAARNKKEAEQLAARAAVLSLLGNSEFETILSEIIKSKIKLYGALDKVKHPCNDNTSIVSSIINTGHIAGIVPAKDSGAEATTAVNAPTTGSSVLPLSVYGVPTVATSVAAVATTEASSRQLPPHYEFNIVKRGPLSVGVEATTAVNAPTTGSSLLPVSVYGFPTVVSSAAAIASAEASSGQLPPHHEFNIVKQGPFPVGNNLPKPDYQAANVPIEFVHSIAEQRIGVGPSSAKKRRRNKYKANKRLRRNAQ